MILISPTEWIPWLVQHGTKWIFILFFWSDACFLILNITSLPDTVYLKNGPEPLEKEIHEILGSKREDRFSNPFFELVHKMCQVHFSYLLRLGNFCKGPADTAKVPAEVPEDSRVLRARRLCMQPPIASKPGSFPLERPGPDNITSQPWSDATCLCNTASSTLSCLFQQKERDKAEVSTSRGGIGARCFRLWLTRDIV